MNRNYYSYVDIDYFNYCYKNRFERLDFFKQKRVGISKIYFYILKFRTMRVDTPYDMPTHILENPEQ